MRLVILCILFLFFLFPSVPAFAACASPAGVAGDLIWNETAKRPAYCNGTEWRNFWKQNTSGSRTDVLKGGGNHICGIRPNGEAYCWGLNAVGGTGLGTTSGNRTTPGRVGTGTDWSVISAGGWVDDIFANNPISYGCGIRSGALYCWGRHYMGQTGLGTTSGSQLTPAQVGSFTDWETVSTGAPTACGIRAGALYCWGSHASGATGLGSSSGSQLTPARVGTFSDWETVSLPTGILGPYACGIRAGSLYCWGPNLLGRTGLGTTSGSQLTPAQVGSFTDWETVTVGGEATCAIRLGALYCWGNNASGSTGLGTTSGQQLTPAQVGTATDWSSVFSVAGNTCGIRSGALYCWGNNASGMNGIGVTSGIQSTPAQVGTATDWTFVGGGDYAMCGIRSNGGLYCWGSNQQYGMTGLGTTSGSQTTPALVNASWGSFGSGGGGGSGGSGPCTGPDGVSGDVVYNSTHHVLQYCDGAAWHAVGPTLGSTGAGCSNPTGAEGDMIFNTTHSAIQYCNGTGWYAVDPEF